MVGSVDEYLDDSSFVATFLLGQEAFALSTKDLREMVRLGDLTAVASSPKFLMGVMNLRGKIVNVIDLACKLELGTCQITAESRVVIVNFQGTFVGLCVDRLDDIFQFDPQELHPVPGHLDANQAKTMQGILVHQTKRFALLDLEKLLE